MHILIALYGFQTGGGEIGPIHLANALLQRGCGVSVLTASAQTNSRIRRLLAPEISVFHTNFVEEVGVQRFLDEAGIDIVETHNIVFDRWLFDKCNDIHTPYIVCHHGSYEMVPLGEARKRWLLANVDHWVYLADKNLKFLGGQPYNEKAFTKLPNAMPINDGAFALSREQMGIPSNAFVFGLASRAIREKGWDVAIRGLRHMRFKSSRPVYLLLCGDGKDLRSLDVTYGDDPKVRFLGFQDSIQGFYRLCDCCILPSRYQGETFPRTLIEAIHAGIPMIATGVGEVRSILQIDDEPLGIIVPPSADDSAFDNAIRDAMERMLDERIYENFRAAVRRNGFRYSMDNLVTDYLAIYEKVLGASHVASKT